MTSEGLAGTAADVAAATALWECCRLQFDPAVLRAAVEAADPTVLSTQAARHGVVGLLWRALSQSGDSGALGEMEEAMANMAEVRRFESMLVVPHGVSLAVGTLTAAGFEPVVLKGPWLAARYPEPGLRSMEDLDVLLPRRDHAPAIAALQRAGWEVVRPSAVDRYDTVLRHPELPSLPLELHFALEPGYRVSTGIDADAAYERRRPVDCLGTPAFAFAPTDELVALAQHAAKPFHTFKRLIWIADLGVVVDHCRRTGEPVDWGAVGRRAAAGRCRTVLAVALALARRVGVEAPEELIDLPQHGWRADALVPLLDVLWPLHSDPEHAFNLRYVLSDRWSWRMRLLVGSKYQLSQDTTHWALDLPVETTSRVVRWARSRRALHGQGPAPLPALPAAAHPEEQPCS